MTRTLPPVLVIAGPTASGKSALALELADALRRHDHQCRQPADLSRSPHPDRAARCGGGGAGAAPALRLSRRRRARLGRRAGARWRWPRSPPRSSAGRLPILVGGTGLYLRALTQGLAPVPDIPPTIRARGGRSSTGALGGAGFRERLAQLDPEAAGAPPAGRPAAPDRAPSRSCGRPACRSASGSAGPAEPAPYRFATILLAPPRAALYAACDAPLRGDDRGRRARRGGGAGRRAVSIPTCRR